MMLSNILNKVLRRPHVQKFEGHTILPPTVLCLRKWVVWKDKVGIVTDLTTTEYVGIHIVDAKGETIQELFVPKSEVMLAKWADIPEPRRPADRNIAASLGYN